MIYEITARGLKPISTEGKTDIPIGTVLHWGGNMGWPEEDFAILDRAETSFGVTYQCASLDNSRFHTVEAHGIKLPDEETRHGQYFFVRDRVLSEDERLTLWQKARALEGAARASKEAQDTQRAEAIERGRAVAAQYIPAHAQAVIVAAYEQDESDSMKDYFATKTTRLVVLGWSKHKRDIFSEMRKHAGKFDQTKHLATPPDEDENREKRTPDNAKWWHPSDEHREKYSMGAGYYLKSSGRYSSGWTVEKRNKHGDEWPEDILMSLGQINLLK